ncbi:VOC family protein [Amycolatopsis sp. A133]|uniref:VOC family protein n=1 Tax=Amycolatopsis sp. A133 TaxID=3064472 RepID=UPI0027EC70AC|nr:VOC family protein [Amycolatopsis sp. A133]MDQ7803374.1 VOC family protein [Amycolatopsis sp. A133]
MTGNTMGYRVLPRLEHVGVVVGDLEAAKAFFAEIGLEVEGEMTVEGGAVDRIVGLAGVRSDVAMLRTPDGHGKLELIRYRTPEGPAGDPRAPSNAPGLRHVLFEVADIEDVLERLRPHGGELVGELVRYEDSFKLCYVRGPEGIIVELAERIG